MWLLSMWNVAHATEQLNFKFYLVLINLNSNTCLVAGVWDSTGHSNLAPPKHTNEEERVVRFGGTGHHMVQEADLELTRGELMLATWRHFFILYLGHCPLDQCLLPWQPLAWLDFPFLSQAADGGHWWGSLSTGLMIWLKDLSLWVEAQQHWALYLLCVHLSSHGSFPLLIGFVTLKDWEVSPWLVLKMVRYIFPAARHSLGNADTWSTQS